MTYLWILLGYAVLMIVIGAIVSRRVRETSSFFVAGRGLSAGLICSTLLAANIGSGSTVGATGLGYRVGLSAWWWVGSAGIGSLILAFAVGPKIWRIAREHSLYTVGDYLEFRYNRSVRGLVAILLWVGSLVILAGQLIAVAWILNVTAGITKPIGCLIATVVVTTYFTLGGLHSTARVNVIQLLVKMAGFSLVFLYLLITYGGWEGLRSMGGAVGQSLDHEGYFNLFGVGIDGVSRWFAILAPSFIISPGILQKVFGARDERAVRRGVAFNALGLLSFAIIPAILGIVAHSKFPNLENSELALPTLLTQLLPLWLGALLLGAIFSAELSAADAVLFMLSTSLSRDLYQSFINPKANDKRLMNVARVTAIVCGVLGGSLGMVLETVISALTIFYTLLTAALLLPLIAGLYTERVTTRAAIASIFASVFVTFALDRVASGQGHWPPLIWGTLAGLLVMVVTLKTEERSRIHKKGRK
jgi:solute:Na+ symporter, SSS family